MLCACRLVMVSSLATSPPHNAERLVRVDLIKSHHIGYLLSCPRNKTPPKSAFSIVAPEDPQSKRLHVLSPIIHRAVLQRFVRGAVTTTNANENKKRFLDASHKTIWLQIKSFVVVVVDLSQCYLGLVRSDQHHHLQLCWCLKGSIYPYSLQEIFFDL